MTDAWVDAIAEARAELDGIDEIVERFLERSETPRVWGEQSAREEVRMNVKGALRYLEKRDAE